jgi:peptidoglycan/xylan/chitin deacetylase (PgdA/CDA1 family)
MDAERRTEIRRWAEGLERSQVAELRAAGRALMMLVDENEELRRRLARLEPRSPSGEPPEPPTADVTARARPRRRTRRPRKPFPWRLAGVVGGVVLAAAILTAIAMAAVRPELQVGGVEDGAVVGPTAAAQLAFWAAGEGQANAEWRVDGRAITPRRRGGRSVFRPPRLADGKHVLEISAGGPLFTTARRRVEFEVDTTAPLLRLDAPAAHRPGQPVRVAGRVEPSARLTRSGRDVALDEDGVFRFELAERPPRGAFVLEVADRAGNRSRWQVPVSVIPRQPVQLVRAVHVTSYGWADASLRRGVLALVDEQKINAIELDLKDEAGLIGWDAAVPYGRRIGAVEDVYDLGRAVQELHAKGVRVIGRLVCFRDPVHAQAAWRAGRRDEVIQTPGGQAYSGYGGFTNFANPVVRKYNVDVAIAAAKLGVDEILYDYVRRPDGPLPSMSFPGLAGPPERAIVRFLEESREALAGTDALVGASVFGVAATRPEEVAQDIPAMARTVDYIAPMVYPSHWGPGEYGVANPNGEPYAITRRSLEDFARKTRFTGARVVPWLQDFSLGVGYGPAEVAAQIRAARDAGMDEFLLWDPAVTYTSDALEPTAKRPALDLRTTPPEGLPGPRRLPDPAPAPLPGAGSQAAGPVSGLPPNELGVVPVLMHHEIRPDRVGDYDQTPAELRAELQLLWRRGHVPVYASELADGELDLPRGKSPVVLTFDDSTVFQLELTSAGEPKPRTAVAILQEFARTHAGFPAKATFFLLREPFGGRSDSAEHVRWLAEHGFELGNHSHDHTPLATLSDAQVQHQLVAGAQVILDAVPDYQIRTLALPLGSMPQRAELAVRGRSGGRSYGPNAVFLVGAGPAPSPYSRDFDRTAIPRIRSSHMPWAAAEDYTFAYWMRHLADHPEQRFVSDGDPAAITVRPADRAKVAPRFRARVGVKR